MAGDAGPLAVMFRRFGPYHVARLEALAAASEVPVVGVEVDGADATYPWQATASTASFRWRTLASGGPVASDAGELRRRLEQALTEEQPAAVAVPGWSDPAALMGLAWCVRNGIPAIMLSDSTMDDEPRRRWREALKRRLLRLASAALVAGSRHVRYLEILGVDRSRIFTGYDVVDNDYFAREADRTREARAYWLERLELPASYFLACARFVAKKNLMRLLDAYAQYRREAGDDAWGLVLVGDGPQRDEIEAALERLGIADRVTLAGFQQYDRLPLYYGLAGAFVLPSTSDQWGLVVNEAMASGLPVLVSDRCGCAADLVEEGENGFTFDPYDVDNLAALMIRVSDPGCDRERMGRESRAIIERWPLRAFSDGLLGAVEMAGNARLPDARLSDRWALQVLARREWMRNPRAWPVPRTVRNWTAKDTM